MNIVDVNNKQYHLDNNGFLKKPNDWSKEFVFALANKNNLVLTNMHWDIIQLLHKKADGIGVLYALQLLRISLNIKNSVLNDLFLTEKNCCFIYRYVDPNNIGFDGLLQACMYANIYVDKLSYKGNIYQLNIWGELFYPERDWTLELANEMATRDGSNLTPKHLEVIDYLHKVYKANHFTPGLKELEKKLLSDKVTNASKFIATHFNNYFVEAFYLAGIPRSSSDTKLRRFVDDNCIEW